MDSSSRSRWLMLARSVGLALVIGVLTYWLAGGVLSRLELFARDVMFQIRGPLDTPQTVALVAIDDASFTQNGLQWPWPRDYLAKIIDNISAGHPKVIAMDILFYEATTADKDQALADAISRAGNVVLVNDISTEVRSGVTIRQLNRPIPVIDQAVAALGLTNFPRDPDGEVRRLLAFQSHNGELLYAWSMQVARLYYGADSFNVISANQLDIGSHTVPLKNQYLLVDYQGPAGSVPYYSAYQVADGLVDSKLFEDKVVILGATSSSLHDEYPTPYASEPPMPGAEINAQAIDAVLQGRFLHPTSDIINVVLAVLAALIGTALTLRLKPIPGLAAVIALIALYGIASAVIFINTRMQMPITGPVLALGLTFVTSTSIQLYEEQRQRARVRGLFERYVSPAAIDQMLGKADIDALSGDRREMTILFSDIRGFTSLSEKLAPDEVVRILNEYLEAMTEIIFKHHGTVDKFEGDAILAIWNAPLLVEDHPSDAVRCAIEMAQRLSEMGEKWAATGQNVLRNGIGINTGMCFVGNIGSVRRMDYTVIGDTVNLASRLEALTKEVGVQILFAESTAEKLPPEIRTKYVTTAQVKGRTQGVRVYTVEPKDYGLYVEEGVDLDHMPEELVQQKK